MTGTSTLAAPWAARRGRAQALCERYSFAREPLILYRSLVDVQASAWSAARAEAPSGADIPAYVAERVLPRVIEVSTAAGPRTLADLVRGRVEGISAPARAAMIRRWLDGEDQLPIERFLARASAGPVLEALGPQAGEACGGPPRAAGEAGGDGETRDGRRCPVCGGLPQLAYIAAPPESLTAGPRSLVCARCATGWPYPRLTCASCGEQDTGRLMILAEDGTEERRLSGSTVRGLRGPSESDGTPRPRFPHMRIDACMTCSRYLVSIDVGRDPQAVPLVDELAAIPLDLHAVERGFIKVIPNLMGA